MPRLECEEQGTPKGAEEDIVAPGRVRLAD